MLIPLGIAQRDQGGDTARRAPETPSAMTSIPTIIYAFLLGALAFAALGSFVCSIRLACR